MEEPFHSDAQRKSAEELIEANAGLPHGRRARVRQRPAAQGDVEQHAVPQATTGTGTRPAARGPEKHVLGPGNVVTAERLETFLEDRDWMSLEEDVLITESGTDVLTTRQEETWLIG